MYPVAKKISCYQGWNSHALSTTASRTTRTASQNTESTVSHSGSPFRTCDCSQVDGLDFCPRAAEAVVEAEYDHLG